MKKKMVEYRTVQRKIAVSCWESNLYFWISTKWGHSLHFYSTCRYRINATLRDLYMNRTSGMIENFLRISDKDFRFLLNLITPLIAKQDTCLQKSVSVRKRFVVTLWFLASGESFEDLKYWARMSLHSISNIVIEMCNALIQILHNQIKLYKMKILYYIQCTFIVYGTVIINIIIKYLGSKNTYNWLFPR